MNPLPDSVLQADDLEDLRVALLALPADQANGLFYRPLPSFGGGRPCMGVWSWDWANVLVGASARELAIVPRGQWLGGEPE